jgi:hypothetical protein
MLVISASPARTGGKGGKYLVLPPGYTGVVPDGYFVLKPPTYINWFFMRGSIADGLGAGLEEHQGKPEGVST